MEMRKARYIILTALVIVATLRASAQTGNQIVVGDIQMKANSEKSLSVSMNNVDKVVAVELSLNVPNGFLVDPNSVTLSDRAQDHQVTARNIDGNRYSIVIISPDNKPFKGTSGPLFSMMLKAGKLNDGDYILSLTDAVMAVSSGRNVIESKKDGIVSIGHLDYQVSDVMASSSNVMPEDEIHVSWRVTNIGTLVGRGGWKENVYLDSPDGISKLLGSAYHEGELRAGAILDRDISLVIPGIPGIDGNASVRVKLIPSSESGETPDLKENNQASGSALKVGKRLTLTPAETMANEVTGNSVRLFLQRSGNATLAQTFNIDCTKDDRVSIPERVTVEKGESGAYVYVQLTANKVYDRDSVVIVTVSGNGYDAVSASIIIQDDSNKPLRVSLDKAVYGEGETIRLKVETDEVVTYDLPLYLTMEQQKRFKMPSAVVIPAGGKSVEVEIPVIDDNIPASDMSIELTVSADGYEPAKALFILNDDDVPAINLDISPMVINESDGDRATFATITRTDVTDNDITVKISDDGDRILLYPQTVSMKAGETEKVIPIGVRDNDMVDGQRDVTITASIYISTCNCNPVGEKQTSVSRTISVLDNDGPALTLTANRTMVLEGDAEGVTVTLRRNEASDKALTVTITSYATDIVVPATVTIPAGQQSVTFKVEVPKNDIQEGNRTVSILASAEGYGSGTIWMTLSDQTLPDMYVKSLSLDVDSVLINEPYKLNVTLGNIGAAKIPERSTFTVNAAGEELTLTITEAIPVGGEHTETLTFQAPSVPGKYPVSVHCNKGGTFTEINAINNDEQRELKVLSPYTWAITTDAETYKVGDTVHLSGSVFNKTGNAAHTAVEPYVMYLGTRTALEAYTDDNGRFELAYQLPGIGGDYSFGVCLPGEGATVEMVKASVFGLARTSTGYVKNRLYLNEPYTVSVPILNLASLPQHHLKATFSDEFGYYTIQAKEIDVIGPNGTADLELTVMSSQPAATNDWERVNVHVTSDEGASLDFVVYNITYSRQAKLVLGTTAISTTATKGQPRTYPVVLTNTGLAATGKISVDIPEGQSFLSVASTKEIPSLSTGDSAIVRLKFNPEGLDVNAIQKGRIAINCENADGVVVTYSVKVVSEDKGSLLVKAADENTYYGNAAGEHPYVSGATVKVKDCNTGVTLYTATTDDNGQALFTDINEGYYTVYVTAPKHSDYTQNVLVSPAQTTEHTASISYDAISIHYEVEEVTIEDRYEITATIDYETQVPVPIVKMDTPEELDLQGVLDGGTLLYNIVLKNVGLITALDVNVSLPEADSVNFIPLTAYTGFDLAPEQTHVIPVYVCRSDLAPTNVKQMMAPRRNENKKPKCNGDTFLGWKWACGENGHYGWLEKPIKWVLRTCDSNYTPPKPRTGKEPIERADTLPPYPLPVEPTMRPRVSSQVDLGAIYDVTCKVLCTLSCLAPDPIGDCLPSSLGKLLKYLNDPSSFEECLSKSFAKALSKKLRIDPICIFNSVTSHYDMHSVKAHKDSKNTGKSLAESYLDKMTIYTDMVNAYPVFFSEMINAPKLESDTSTYYQVFSNLIHINADLANLHNHNQLYTQSIDQLYRKELESMPQQKADWYDFNLRSYIERMVNTYRMEDKLPVSGDNYMRPEVVDSIQNKLDSCYTAIKGMGYIDVDELMQAIHEDAVAINAGSENTCATVKVKLSQEMVLTRQAFRGTLTIENSTDMDLTGLDVVLTVTDENGKFATSREMQMTRESAEGFVTVGDSLKLEAGATGTITYLFIPTKHAAPETAMTYSFGGTLYFNDGTEDQVRSLYPASLVVKPTPDLDLTYFVQRDVYGDNPLTPDVTEPVIPAEFSVLIHNKGKGDATNVRMITHQPEIVENEKGLLVDFAIVSSSINGAPTMMALEDDIATEFGDIPAGACSYATWGLTSTLLGHFKGYDVSYAHLNSYDNPDLSLLNQVDIHELIHSVNATIGDKQYRAWVTNDIADAQDSPDHIYFSNGTDEDLHALTGSTTITKLDATRYRVTVNTPTREWYYANVLNPAGKYARVSSITNEATGIQLDPENFWTTDYTMLDGKDPVLEYKLHLVDLAAGSGTMSYIITFEPIPDTILAVNQIYAVPDEDDIAREPIGQLTVVFNKDIISSTFNRDDILVRHEGSVVDTELPISQIDGRTFVINTSALTDNGYYVLQVNTSDIKDTEGFYGSEGKKVSWTLFRDGIVGITATVVPSEAGKVNAVSNATYGSTIKLVTTANPGFEFERWTIGDETLSENPIFEWEANREINIVANYKRKTYSVTIQTENEHGTVTGFYTGIYYYGDSLRLKATPDDGYVFCGWLIDGENHGGEAEQTFVIYDQMNLAATFVSDDTDGVKDYTSIPERLHTIHTLTGILIGRDLDADHIRRLPRGIYIIDGRKVSIR